MIPGPQVTSPLWQERIADLIREIREEALHPWHAPGVQAALALRASDPLALVALEAVAAAITRPDQRTPAIIAMDGRHRHLLDPPGTPVATVHTLVCEHDQRPSRCPECQGRGVPCPPDLSRQMRAAIRDAQDRPTSRPPKEPA